MNVVGRGMASLPKEVQTDEAAPSSPPEKVQARGLSRSSILVRWEPPKKPNGRITVGIDDIIVQSLGDYLVRGIKIRYISLLLVS